MTSIRYSILRSLRDRLATLTGWSAQLRGTENNGTGTKVLAVVSFLGEDKVFGATGLYTCTMTVGVSIQARVADATSTFLSDPFAYLDSLVVAAETKIHGPDSWGPSPGFSDVRIDGHDVADPEVGDEFLDVAALLRLTFTYQHQITDPEAP
jgi:hypothetical protein